MMRAILLAVVCVAVVLAGSPTAKASHITNIGSVDVIDNVFSSGGGIFGGALLSGTDESWLVFNATSGDSINIAFNSSGGVAHIGAIFFDSGDGVIQVGDAMNIVNWDNDNTGVGSPLQVISGPSTYVSGGLSAGSAPYLFGGSGSPPLVHQFTAGFTGQYGIVVASNQSSSSATAVPFTVTLSGNTSTAIPEPSSIVLLSIGAIGLFGYGYRRKRKQAA